MTQGITQTKMEAHFARGSVLTPVTHIVLLQDTDETSVLEQGGKPTHGMTLWTKGVLGCACLSRSWNSCRKLRRDVFLSESVPALPDPGSCALTSVCDAYPLSRLLCCHRPRQCPCLPSLRFPGLLAAAISPQYSHISHKHRLRWTGTQFSRA